MKKRLIGIDVIRILCAILILFFHLGGRGIEFKGWNEWIGNQVEFIMILFFMISGFCLSFSKRNLSGKNEILDFYKRRILKLLPLYWVIEIYLLIISIYYGSEWINRIKIFSDKIIRFADGLSGRSICWGRLVYWKYYDVLSYVSYYPNIDR